MLSHEAPNPFQGTEYFTPSLLSPAKATDSLALCVNPPIHAYCAHGTRPRPASLGLLVPSLSRAMLALGRDGPCGEPCGLSDCLCPTHLDSHRHRPISGTDIATSVCMNYQLPTVVAARESPSPFARLPVLIPHAGSCYGYVNTLRVEVSTKWGG